MPTDPIANEREAIHRVYQGTIAAVNEAKLSPMALFSFAGAVMSQAILHAADGDRQMAIALADQAAASARQIINAKFGN